MGNFIRARKILYTYLYSKFLAEDGPWCNMGELEEFDGSSRYMKSALMFACDMGHVITKSSGSIRLNGFGIQYVEDEYSEGKHGY